MKSLLTCMAVGLSIAALSQAVVAKTTEYAPRALTVVSTPSGMPTLLPLFTSSGVRQDKIGPAQQVAMRMSDWGCDFSGGNSYCYLCWEEPATGRSVCKIYN